jgi:hypothetical protein
VVDLGRPASRVAVSFGVSAATVSRVPLRLGLAGDNLLRRPSSRLHPSSAVIISITKSHLAFAAAAASFGACS